MSYTCLFVPHEIFVQKYLIVTNELIMELHLMTYIVQWHLITSDETPYMNI